MQIKNPKENPWLEAVSYTRVCFCDTKVTCKLALSGQGDNQSLEACPVTEPPERGVQQTEGCLFHSPTLQHATAQEKNTAPIASSECQRLTRLILRTVQGRQQWGFRK